MPATAKNSKREEPPRHSCSLHWRSLQELAAPTRHRLLLDVNSLPHPHPCALNSHALRLPFPPPPQGLHLPLPPLQTQRQKKTHLKAHNHTAPHPQSLPKCTSKGILGAVPSTAAAAADAGVAVQRKGGAFIRVAFLTPSPPTALVHIHSHSLWVLSLPPLSPPQTLALLYNARGELSKDQRMQVGPLLQPCWQSRQLVAAS